MATFVGNPNQNDSFTGGSGADEFQFSTADLNGADTLTGGGGTDLLRFTNAGTIAGAAFANVSGIEGITLFGTGPNSITLTDALVGSANATLLTVTGGAGADTVDASGVNTAGYRVAINAGAGADTLIGGGANNTFRFAAADLTSADSVVGGEGGRPDRIHDRRDHRRQRLHPRDGRRVRRARQRVE